MTSMCPKCGRPKATEYPAPKEACIGGRGCQLVSRYYQRGRRDGIDEGVQIAKERHVIDNAEVNWIGVEAEAERAKAQ